MFNKKFNKLISYYENNKEKEFDKWLKFERILKPGKQGIVGIFSINDTDEQYIFKMSQCLNFLVNHEMVVMQGLQKITKFCPHFCKGIGIVKALTEPDRKSKNPFQLKSKYPIEREILLCELIDKSHKFYNYIKTLDISEDILYSVIKQVLLSISIAQKQKKFTHYDLHSNNIMIKKCNKNLVFLYVMDSENQFCVPTYGYYPIIIDYGFSYIEDMEDGPLWTSLAHTDVGFMSDRFDWVADPKLFLMGVSDEIKNKRGTQRSKKLRRIVRNMFYPLKIDLDNGWDNVDKKGAVDYVIDILETCGTTSKIFKEYEYYCIDILQSLIILPLESQDYTDIEKTYKIFLNEWTKIENEISNEFYNLYILKEIVNLARKLRSDYLQQDTQNQSVNIFKNGIYQVLDKVSKFCIPKNVNYEKLLCSLLLLSQHIEGILYDVITTRMKEKEKEYEKMPLQSIDEIYGTIEVNLKDEYIYNEETTFCIINNTSQSNDLFEIPYSEIKMINKLHPILRGCYIYDLYKKSK